MKGTVDLVAEVAETTEGTDDFDKKLVARIVVQPSPTLTNPVWLSYYLSDDETSDFLLPYQEAKQSYTFFHGSRRFLINTQVDPFTDVDGTITMEMKKSDLPPGYEFKGDKDSNKKLIFTVRNDPTATHPDLSIAAAKTAVDEGQTAEFTLKLDKPWNEDNDLVVDVYVDSKPIVHLSNDQLDRREVRFKKGESSATLRVKTRVNATDDDDGKIRARVDNVSSHNIRRTGPQKAEVTLTNVETLTGSILRVADVTVAEGSWATFQLKTDQPLASDASVKIQVLVGNDLTTLRPLPDFTNSAAFRNDFNPLQPDGNIQTGATITLQSGQKIFPIRVKAKNDDVYEGNEAFGLRIYEPKNIVIGDNSEDEVVALATIDDSVDTPVLTISSPSVKEGNKPFVNFEPTGGHNTLDYELTLSKPSLLTGKLWTQHGLRGTASWRDYSDIGSYPHGWIEFPPGKTSHTISVVINGDDDVEPDETLVALFSRPTNMIFADGSINQFVTGTIENDDGKPKPRQYVHLSDAGGVTEGQEAIFRAYLVNESRQEVAASDNCTIFWQTRNGTAMAGDDFTTVNSSSTIVKGKSGIDLKVQTIKDQVAEPNETFEIKYTTIQSSGWCKFAKSNVYTTASATITDGSVVTVGEAEKVTEGQPMLFPVKLNLAAATDVTVAWKTEDGAAKAGTDYIAQTSQTLTIPAGETEGYLRVPTSQDMVDEHDEKFFVVVETVTGGALATKSRRFPGVIRDDDSRPDIVISDVRVTESKVASLAVSLSRASEKQIKMSWLTQEIDEEESGFSGDVAASGSDYTRGGAC